MNNEPTNKLFFEEEKQNTTYIKDKKYKGYTIISNYIIFDTITSANAKEIYLIIKNFLDRNKPITDKLIYNTLKMKPRTFYTYKKELLERGYLDRKREEKSNKYIYMLMETPKAEREEHIKNMSLIEFSNELDNLLNAFNKRAKMSNNERKQFKEKYEEFKAIINANWLK